MLIRTRSRRRRACAVSVFAACISAPMALAAIDSDPTNDTMTGAETLTTIIGERVTHSAELIDAHERLDVDFFMIDALAGDAVTITLVRATDNSIANSADLNLRLHAYTQSADLLSAPGIGENPAMTFSPDSDGVIYIGVGLERDANLDGVDDQQPEQRDGGIFQVETTAGFYDIEITIDRSIGPDEFILFEDPADCENEVNATCPPAQTLFPDNGDCIIGSLVKREYPDCEPDTFMVLFNKELEIIASDDNNSTLGNGWASGLQGINDALGFIDNGNGTRSLRIGVTGRPDGLDGVFNGLFLNGAHEQFGEFTLTVTFSDAGGALVSEEIYTNRFNSGAEAFYINYDVPLSAASARIDIDNQTGAIAALPDQDVFHFEGLIPFCDYFITQVGGLNCYCIPTDTVMAWVDKNCAIIWDSYEYDAQSGYEELVVIADYRGRANFVIAGEDQRSRLLWVGLDLNAQDTIGDDRAPINCELPDPNIDDGCYTLCIRLAPPHHDADGPMDNTSVVGGAAGEVARLHEAMAHGDINVDGRTDTADLGVLIGNFGWVQ